MLPVKASVTAAVKKLRESISTGGCLIVSVTESAARPSKADEPPVWSEVTGLALLAHTDSDTQSSIWFSAKRSHHPNHFGKYPILGCQVGYDLKRQVVALSRLGVELAGL